ncbi:MAG: DNA methyltransferase, partial [Planctomycetota bacterium JB042]
MRTRGDADEAAALAASWRAATGEGRTLTHGVHAYPARMHPEQARLLIERLAPPGGVVLDPFCGSGTVLIEAFARGRRAIGSDVHPLAVRLARLKSRRVPASARRRVEEAAARIAKTAARAGRARDEEPAAPPEALRWYAPHVLLELGAIGEGIAAREDARTREFLHFVLSSIVVKVSRRRSETDPRGGARDLPLGGTATLFAERAVELGRGLAQLERAAAPRAGAPPVAEPVVARADARAMPVADASVDLVLTSPPYLGT